MVEKYVILANSNDKTFDIPRQLIEINGEPIVKRTIRLLKENGVKDIIVTACDKRFDGLDAKRYEPKNYNYDYKTGKGYWLNAFPPELMNEPVCFIWGDVYFSEEAIKTIVETDTDSALFFCSYKNNKKEYIKEHDEPFAYKIVDTKLFMEHVEKVKRMYDEGKTIRNPIVWEVYRSLNGLDVNEHVMTDNYVAINDVSCDIDSKKDVNKLKLKVENNVSKKLSIVITFYKTYDLTKKLLEVLIPQLNDNIEVILVDDGCNETRLDEFKDKIKIIHLKENKGGAYASNVGIFEAKGKYIGFIDSDDMISSDYIKVLLNAINNHDEDVIFMDWQDMNSGAIVKRPNNYAPWKAIYDRKVIPIFPEGRRYSYDVPFYEELNSKEYTKYYTDKLLYFYNSNREGNLTTEKEKLRKENEKMVKCEVIENFDLGKFDEIKIVSRKARNVKGSLYVGDIFECNQEMADYLTGGNAKKKVVVKVIEVIPEEKKEPKIEVVIDEEKVKEEVVKEEFAKNEKPKYNKRKKGGK